MSAVAADLGRRSPSATVLCAVAEGHAALAVWERTPPGDVLAEAARLRDGASMRQRVTVDARRPDLAVARCVEALLTTASSDDARACAAPDASALGRDLRQLLALALPLAARSPLTLRVERITDDGCRLFHTDRVQARLLCTYAGEGTQWLPDAAVDRDRLGNGDNRHVTDPTAQRSIATGAVALLRGDLSRHGPGVMHRSPPLGADRPRLLAAVDW